MIDALLGGCLGVVIGSGFSWWMHRESIQRKARYLAIRVVCLLDKYLEDCVSVVKDDGLCYGSRTEDGCLEPQVACPSAPNFPDDIDWKSINYDLMYEILSFPSDIEAADGVISHTWDHVAFPPDYEEGFEERAFQYAKLGITAHKLAQKIRDQYEIPPRNYDEWNPVSELESELKKINIQREKRATLLPKLPSGEINVSQINNKEN